LTHALALVVLVLLGGSAWADGPERAEGACADYVRPPVRVGATPAALRELSGLVASKRNPGIFWGHNDSENAFEVIALRASGEVVSVHRIAGASALDIEDVARGPCHGRPLRTCLYLGDIGDNFEMRRQVQLFEIDEPTALETGPVTTRRLAFRYEDGAHNAEALLADPRTGTLWVVTKRLDDLGRLYRLENLDADGVGRAVFVRRLRAPSGFGALTTGGDSHPDAARVLLRTYTGVWEFRGRPGEDVGAILAAEPVEVPGPRQPQSEAIAYEANGSSYVVGSEQVGAPIYRVLCEPPAAD